MITTILFTLLTKLYIMAMEFATGLTEQSQEASRLSDYNGLYIGYLY